LRRTQGGFWEKNPPYSLCDTNSRLDINPGAKLVRKCSGKANSTESGPQKEQTKIVTHEKVSSFVKIPQRAMLKKRRCHKEEKKPFPLPAKST